MSDNFDPRTSKYRRPRNYFSLPALLFGMALGIGGALFYAWNLAPVEEFDTEPWQLNATDRAHYIVAIMLDYNYDGDLSRAVDRLVQLRLPGDPIQVVADTACELASTGYINNSSGLRGVQAMMSFYQSQGRTSCADLLIVPSTPEPNNLVTIDVPTPTLPPPATKTPTPEVTLVATSTTFVIVPTNAPQSSFELVRLEEFCSTQLPGIIEVYVQDGGGDGIAGQPVRVRWSSGEDTFFTGLKAERGPAYADFQMEQGISYTIDMPGLSNSSSTPISATPCTDPENNQDTLLSYRAVFRPSG